MIIVSCWCAIHSEYRTTGRLGFVGSLKGNEVGYGTTAHFALLATDIPAPSRCGTLGRQVPRSPRARISRSRCHSSHRCSSSRLQVDRDRVSFAVVENISRNQARARAHRASVICGIDGRRADTRAAASTRNHQGGIIGDDVETRVSGRSRRRSRRRSPTTSDYAHCRAVLTLVRDYLNSTATRLVASDAFEFFET